MIRTFLLLASVALATPAFAQTTLLTYNFEGICENCDTPNSTAIARLVVKDYTPGTALTDANLVDLFYLSSQTILSFQSGSLSGVLGTAPGAYNVNFRYFVDFGFGQIESNFNTLDSALWTANPPYTGQGFERGNSGRWSLVGAPAAPVPEPAVWGTMLTGFGLVGGLVRRRRASGRPVIA